MELTSHRLDIWVSIKILRADESKVSRELTAFRHLESCPGVVQLLDHFLHQGPNGTHQCLVLELLGPSVNIIVADNFEDGDRLETEFVIKMSRKLLETVEYIHTLGYVHGGLSFDSPWYQR